MLLNVPLWSVFPFVAMLLSIAIFPLAAPHFWHSNLRKGLVALVLSLPVLILLGYLQSQGQAGVSRLLHTLSEYIEFIALLGALYTVAGGIVLQGSTKPTPWVNCGLLLTGAVLANLIGTTGASMLLIRPMLRINKPRLHHQHVAIFFIFIVSNVAGLLTPLGDPPLFLGFLKGVDFFWTLQLWPQFLVTVGILLVIFFVWDWYLLGHEKLTAPPEIEPWRLRGLINFLFLAGIVGTVLLQSEQIMGSWKLEFPWPPILMATMALLSWIFTPGELRKINEFGWEAIIEVAVLFIGIFVTMIPALVYLASHSNELGLAHAWEYFWLSGILSSFLDNAPTYLTFAELAAQGDSLTTLMAQPQILAAISVGSVFMGANTYIGNGPNFMVKAIAESVGYRMPSFFGYMLYSGTILLPIFGLITWLFFR